MFETTTINPVAIFHRLQSTVAFPAFESIASAESEPSPGVPAVGRTNKAR